MVDWPTTLPAEGLAGITDQRKSTKIRSSVDQGPAIVRRRYTRAVRNVNIPIVLTDAERAIFDDWYDNDLVGGTLSFNYIDPRGGSVRSFRFREEDGPDWQGSGGGDVKRWSTTLALETF